MSWESLRLADNDMGEETIDHALKVVGKRHSHSRGLEV